MTKRQLSAVLSLSLTTFAGCGSNGGGGGAEEISCGAGSGYRIPFCSQVANYDAGYGVPGVDQISVDCIAGPRGAGVYESPNGTYFVAGSYKLGSFGGASIELNWGGTTSYSSYEDYPIAARGEGVFAVSATKTEGGDGNLFLSMVSGSMWMFDLIPVNEGCGTAFESTLPSDRAPSDGAQAPRAYGPTGDAVPAGGMIP